MESPPDTAYPSYDQPRLTFKFSRPKEDVEMDSVIVDENEERVTPDKGNVSDAEGANFSPPKKDRARRDAAEQSIDNTTHDDEEEEEDPPSGDDVTEEVYEVEKILDERGSGKKKEYKVKWKGYGPEYDTWEPAENLLESAAEAIKAYQRKSAGGSSKKTPGRPKSAKKEPSSSSKKKDREFTLPQGDQSSDEEEESPKKRHPTKAALKAFDEPKLIVRSGPSEVQKNRAGWLFENDSDDSDSDDESKKAKKEKKATEEKAVDQPRKEKSPSPSISSMNGSARKESKRDKKRREEKERKERREQEKTLKRAAEEKLVKEEGDEHPVKKRGRGSSSERVVSSSAVNGAPPRSDATVEVVGMARVDGETMVAIKEYGSEPRIVSIKDAYEKNAWGLVKYLIDKADFGSSSR